MREKGKCRVYQPFVCLLACLRLYDSPASPGAPLRERQERLVITALTVCEEYTGSSSSNREKISLKTIFKLIIVKANLP